MGALDVITERLDGVSRCEGALFRFLGENHMNTKFEHDSEKCQHPDDLWYEDDPWPEDMETFNIVAVGVVAVKMVINSSLA